MKFKETFIYSVISDAWSKWSRLNPYSAVLSLPLFLLMIICAVAMCVFIDGYYACKELF